MAHACRVLERVNFLDACQPYDIVCLFFVCHMRLCSCEYVHYRIHRIIPNNVCREIFNSIVNYDDGRAEALSDCYLIIVVDTAITTTK